VGDRVAFSLRGAIDNDADDGASQVPQVGKSRKPMPQRNRAGNPANTAAIEITLARFILMLAVAFATLDRIDRNLSVPGPVSSTGRG
jgi:hypothetical protein